LNLFRQYFHFPSPGSGLEELIRPRAEGGKDKGFGLRDKREKELLL